MRGSLSWRPKFVSPKIGKPANYAICKRSPKPCAASTPTMPAKQRGKKWAELACELAKLVKLKREFSAPIQTRSAPALLASTFTF
jgi:hypothetical protein